MKTLFITITGGFGIRNIVASGVLDRLRKVRGLRIVIFTPFVNNRSILHPIIGDFENIVFEDIDVYLLNVFERFFKKLSELVFFNINYVGTVKLREITWVKKDLKTYIGTKFLKGLLGKNRYLMALFERFSGLCGILTRKRRSASFKKYRPNLLFTTDFLYSHEWAFVMEARRQGVPVISMNANWDHFTKGISHRADWYIVWNKFNQRQVVEYWGYPPERVLIAGILHQDSFVRDRHKFLSKKELLSKIGVKGEKKLIVYATARNLIVDRDIIEMICAGIKNGEIKYPAHLHVRVHPEDDTERYADLLERFSDVLTIEGPGKTIQQRVWSKQMAFSDMREGNIWCPDEEDTVHYGSLISSADVVVNVASSVTLDAAALNVPIVNIAFDGYRRVEFVDSVARIFLFTHYEFIPKSGGARIARNREELIKYINMYLENPDLDREGRRRIVGEHCGPIDGKAAERISNFIIQRLQ